MAQSENFLVVTCQECGKQYGTDPEKLKKEQVTFPCKQCGAQVTAVRPRRGVATQTVNQSSPAPIENVLPRKSIFRMGLTIKFLLFTILPLVIISVAVVLIADNRMRSLQTQTISSSTEVVKDVSEDLILQISETVARQTRQYLYSHPDLRKERFNRDIYFKKVVLQKIGETGATSLYEIAGDNSAWLTWADVNPTLVGQDMRVMESVLGDHFTDYWKIITGVKKGNISKGVYKWPDKKGKLRDKFMVCTPIEGTPFVISASIFVDEIITPLRAIEAQGNQVAQQIRITLVAILGCGLLLIFFLLLFYGKSITSKIKRLADWADSISLGHLDSQPVELNTGDEISELAEAVARMQESIRLSLRRLQKKRSTS